MVTPSAWVAATATSGSSSMVRATTPPDTRTPRRPADRARSDPISSGSAASGITSTSAPIDARISRRPVRDGLTPTPSMHTWLPGTRVAATTQNAADEKSPGTSSSKAGNGRCFPAASVTVPGAIETGRPSHASIRSVWSRDAPGSATLVGPSACSPARRTAPFTWALAIGMS